MFRERYFAAFIAISALPCTPAPAQESITFESGKDEGPGWTSLATTYVDLGGRSNKSLPRVSRLKCYGEGPNFAFAMDGSANLTMFSLSFLGEPGSDGEQDEITRGGDHLWLFIDGERWEFARIAKKWLFKNVQYPTLANEIVLPVWHGHSAVRRSAAEPWISLQLIAHRLISARHLSWGFKSRDWTVQDKTQPENDLPHGWQTKRYEIDAGSIRSSFNWCARHVSADEAYMLPANVGYPR